MENRVARVTEEIDLAGGIVHTLDELRNRGVSLAIGDGLQLPCGVLLPHGSFMSSSVSLRQGSDCMRRAALRSFVWAAQ